MTVTFGKSKPIDEVTLDDVLHHPIWMWALDEETVEGQDETWTKPITNTTDVGEDIAYVYPSLLFRVVGTDLHAFGDLDMFQSKEGQVTGFHIWDGDRWQDPSDIAGLAPPVTLEAVPTILGRAGARDRERRR